MDGLIGIQKGHIQGNGGDSLWRTVVVFVVVVLSVVVLSAVLFAAVVVVEQV